MNERTNTLELNENSEEEVKKILLGRRIIRVEEGKLDPNNAGWSDITGKLTLDDGTEIYVAPNQGGCSCGAGNYELTALATVENAITNVELRADRSDDGWGDGPTRYGIYVVADAHEVGAVIIDGDDGNGYYGTGYSLSVVFPPEGQETQAILDDPETMAAIAEAEAE